MAESVRQLTRAIASGNTEAFARFYRERFDVMYAHARKATGRDEAFCLDVVQDAMMRMIRSMRPIDTEARLAAYLRAVVQSAACDLLRQEARRRQREQRFARDRREADERHDDVDARIAWLRKELNTLDDRQIELMLMRHRFGWTLAKIGATVGLRPGAVDGRLTRITNMLRRKATEVFDE
ncbi:MAG: sigma-70 family RNA polymerase sigma factor [Phycisphaerales bacterium]|nr:sigma-70 family RNA polymerase sigma factor [Phycisphaerales bacterium]